MRKSMIAAMLLMGALSGFANSGNARGVSEMERGESGSGTCTVTLEATVNIIGQSLKVSCSASSSTSCKEAMLIAKSCLDESKRMIRK